jgi:hypothetical protein
MKIAELLYEAGLQAELKAAFTPAGKLSDLVDADILDAVAGALESKPSEKAYTLSPSTPAQKAAAASIKQSAKRMADGFDVARMAGGRKAVVIGSKIITSQYQFNLLQA